MDYIFISELSVSSNTESHEHEIKFTKSYNCEDADNVNDRFIKDGKNFYIVYTGTPNITYMSDGSAEQEAELARIKNYIDSLDVATLDYDELPNQLKVYYYADDLAPNTWHEYNNEWQSDLMPCKIMQGAHNVVFARYGTAEPGAYTIKHCRVANSTVSYNTDSTKLVYVDGDDFVVNGTTYDRDLCIVVTGNVSISTTTAAYAAVIEDAV